MRTRNFPNRKLRRQVAVFRRLSSTGYPPSRQHEMFVLHGRIPADYRGFTMRNLTDIRFRQGASARKGLIN